MLLASQAPVAEPLSFVWPHIIVAIFSISIMISLLMLCISTHCYRNAKKKENPYGEIVTTPTADVSTSTTTLRNKTDGSRLPYPIHRSCLNLNSHERSFHRFSAPIPHCSAKTQRALPKLPELSTQLENKNPGAIYSTIDHSASVVDGNSSFLYGEGPANPTYESIDADLLYSKLGNGGPAVKRYDYPIFTSENRPSVITDDVLYQSASHIYAGVSEDPYSSITSHTGGEMNYDTGYSRVRENVNMESSQNYLANAQIENRTLDHLYSRIRRGPSMNRTTNSSIHRPLASNEFAAEYISSGSDKTNREPSYRYITVRESVDAIRQRLNERNASSNVPQSVVVDGGGSIREHYYSSIGGSDYETLQISAASTNHPCCDSWDVPSTSCVSNDKQSETIPKTIDICENITPNPPISPIPSPIPLYVTAINDNNNLEKTQLSLSGASMDKAINDNDNYSNISEKIRKLRTNFFDQELKLLKDLKQPTSTDLRFGQLLGATKQHETSKCINSSGTNPNLSPEHHIDQTSGNQMSTNFDDIYSHLPKFTADRSYIHSAQDVTQTVPISTTNDQEKLHQEQCKNIAQNSGSHNSDEAVVFGAEQSVKEDVTFEQEGSNEKGQCFICHGPDKQAGNNNNNSNSTSFTEASSNKVENSIEEDIEARSCFYPRSLEGDDDMEDDRSVQTSNLNFSHESIDENVRADEDINSGVRTASIDPSWSLISSGENILLYINRTGSKSSEDSGINQCNLLKN